MSAPGHEFREAEYLGLGYLAITSSELLARLMAGDQLSDDDKFTLRRAQDFLCDVSNGARLVTSGIQRNASASDAIQKLSYAVEPLKLLQEEFRSADVGETLEKVAGSIGNALQASDGADRTDLELAKNFFRELHVFLANLVEVGKRRTGVDFGFGSALLSHA